MRQTHSSSWELTQSSKFKVFIDIRSILIRLRGVDCLAWSIMLFSPALDPGGAAPHEWPEYALARRLLVREHYHKDDMGDFLSRGGGSSLCLPSFCKLLTVFQLGEPNSHYLQPWQSKGFLQTSLHFTCFFLSHSYTTFFIILTE